MSRRRRTTRAIALALTFTLPGLLWAGPTLAWGRMGGFSGGFNRFGGGASINRGGWGGGDVNRSSFGNVDRGGSQGFDNRTYNGGFDNRTTVNQGFDNRTWGNNDRIGNTTINNTTVDRTGAWNNGNWNRTGWDANGRRVCTGGSCNVNISGNNAWGYRGYGGWGYGGAGWPGWGAWGAWYAGTAAVTGLLSVATVSSLVTAAQSASQPTIQIPNTNAYLNYPSVQGYGGQNVSFEYTIAGQQFSAIGNCQSFTINGAPPQSGNQQQLLNAACSVAYGSP